MIPGPVFLIPIPIPLGLIPILLPIPVLRKNFDPDSDSDSSIMRFRFLFQCFAYSMIPTLTLIPISIPVTFREIANLFTENVSFQTSGAVRRYEQPLKINTLFSEKVRD